MDIENTLAGAPANSGGPLPPGLRVSLTDAQGATHLLTRTPYVIGRKHGDLVVNHGTVSGKHASIERGEASFVIVDQGSTNGTFVNNERIVRRDIGNMDELRFGDVTFTFNVVEDRYGMHDTPAAAPQADPNGTLIIASAPNVAEIPAGKTVMLFAETGGVEQVIRLTKRITTVGRTEGEVVLPDQALSRRHFQIEFYPDGFGLKDLGSANGTQIDGRPVSYTRVAAGKEFTAGRTRFRLETRG